MPDRWDALLLPLPNYIFKIASKRLLYNAMLQLYVEGLSNRMNEHDPTHWGNGGGKKRV